MAKIKRGATSRKVTGGAKRKHSVRARRNTGRQAQLWVDTISINLAAKRKELVKYQQYAKWSLWAKKRIPQMRRTIKITEGKLTYYKNVVAGYKKRGLI